MKIHWRKASQPVEHIQIKSFWKVQYMMIHDHTWSYMIIHDHLFLLQPHFRRGFAMCVVPCCWVPNPYNITMTVGKPDHLVGVPEMFILNCIIHWIFNTLVGSSNYWLVVWNIWLLWLSRNSWECHDPNWRTHFFQRGRLKPPTRLWL